MIFNKFVSNYRVIINITYRIISIINCGLVGNTYFQELAPELGPIKQSEINPALN